MVEIKFSLRRRSGTVSTQPNQGKGKNPDQDRYGGYAGYQPRKPADDPYGAYYRPGGNQQEEPIGTAQSDSNYVYGQRQQQQYRSSSGSSRASSGQQQRQNNVYEPPSSVTGRRYGSSSQKSTGLEPKYAAVLSYLGLWFTG